MSALKSYNIYLHIKLARTTSNIELFFSAIRAKGGFNNNPTCRQFEGAYKRLLIHHEISGSTSANCLALDPISILSISSATKIPATQIMPVNSRVLDTDDLLRIISEAEPYTQEDIFYNKDTTVITEQVGFGFENIREYNYDIVGHIAGLVLKWLKNVVYCETCLSALETNDFVSRLSQMKNYEDSLIGLQKPSQDLVDICKITEVQIKHLEKCGKLKNDNKLMLTLQTSVMKNMGASCFDSLCDHVFEEILEGNHVFTLIKLIVQKYAKVRLHYISETINDKIIKTRIRSIFKNAVIFQGQ